MTDQATEQSGQSNAALTSNDLGALFAKANGPQESEQPKGQAPLNEGEQAQADDGESPSEVPSEGQEPSVPKFKVPALEGDGFEELTAEEYKARVLMQKDYTQKTQKVAEKSKEVEAERIKVTQVLSEKAQAMEDNLAMLGHAIQSFDAQVDWAALREMDPAAYVAEREKQQARLATFKQSADQLKAVRQEQEQQARAIAAQQLVEMIPTWLDPSVAKKEAEEVRQYLTKSGYSPQEVEAINDPRVIVMARELSRYEALKNKAAETKAQVEKAPQLAKPGAPNQGNPQALAAHRAAKAFEKAPSIDGLAGLFAATSKRK